MHRTLSHFIVELVQNSIDAKSKNIRVELFENDKVVKLIVVDDGVGIPTNIIENFDNCKSIKSEKHQYRDEGLGLLLLREFSKRHKGIVKLFTNRVEVEVQKVSLGDIPETLSMIMANEELQKLEFYHNKNGKSYSISSKELKENIGELATIKSILAVKKLLGKLESSIN